MLTEAGSQDKQLTSLNAIGNYAHLRFVNVSKNQIADLTPLGDLPYLVCVDASENALATPCTLPQAYLQTLDVSQNQIETLQGFQSASLASLKANGNHVQVLRLWTGANGSMIDFCLHIGNQLTAINGLGGMPSLQILEAASNNLEDLSSLAAETSKLERLNLQENKLTSVRGVEAHPTLKALSLQMNNVGICWPWCLTCVRLLTQLLVCQIETMEGLEPLAQLGSLEILDLSGNPVTEIENYRLQLILLVPHLKKLDDVGITEDERIAAVELKQAKEAADAAAAEQDE